METVYDYETFANIADLKTYLDGQSDGTAIGTPLAVRLSGVNLSEQETNIESLFAALDASDKYIALDLSACKGMTAWTRYDKGADKIVSLILPDTVTEAEPRQCGLEGRGINT
ncbi:hypothetical protein [Treponema endosymbiont of Eucomonympha sp.]|uniref:hypothetical protein n=1 Tax=Treponema endosymbiont of Eucomonympha sp. TaxID=1580831 RepID=UPI000750B13B|nr:hypothetical protein [Treponema endosymbiont of Eucomonympha sp.]